MLGALPVDEDEEESDFELLEELPPLPDEPEPPEELPLSPDEPESLEAEAVDDLPEAEDLASERESLR